LRIFPQLQDTGKKEASPKKANLEREDKR